MNYKWIETLFYVATGRSSKQVASVMDITIDAVTKNLERARIKLDAKTTAEAIYKAAKSGLIVVLITASFSNAFNAGQPLVRVSRQRVLVRTLQSAKLSQQHHRLT